jgi:serine/threonine protein kinase
MVSMLEYLHGLDPPIVHRDFTPDNLILSDDKTLALVDFGAANQFLGAITGTLIGKQSYMPPEQIRGKAVPASDLYALGGTLYFLITGEDPAVLNTLKPSERAMDVPQSLDDLIFNLTRLEVAQRANIAQVKVALQSMQTAMALPMME